MQSRMLNRIAVGCMMLGSSAAMAQAPEQVEYTTGRGEEVRVGIYGTVQEPCTGFPAPQIRVLEPPASGDLVVRLLPVPIPATGEACAGSEIPALVLFYDPDPDFVGADSAVIEAGIPGYPSRTQRLTVEVAE